MKTLVWIESLNGQLSDASLDIVSYFSLRGEVVAVTLEDSDAAVENLGNRGASHVVSIRSSQVDFQAFGRALSELAVSSGCAVIAVAASAAGHVLAGTVSARIDAACVTQ